jgi:hypothetical protein
MKHNKLLIAALTSRPPYLDNFTGEGRTNSLICRRYHRQPRHVPTPPPFYPCRPHFSVMLDVKAFWLICGIPSFSYIRVISHFQ